MRLRGTWVGRGLLVCPCSLQKPPEISFAFNNFRPLFLPQSQKSAEDLGVQKNPAVTLELGLCRPKSGWDKIQALLLLVWICDIFR